LSFPFRLLLLLVGCALLLFPALGAAPLERAEIYFLDGARSMVERGDYLVPYYRGQPFFDKPPLAYWLMAAAFRLLGFTPEAARLVPALATLCVIAATVWLGRLLFDRRTALWAASVLASTLAFVVFGRIAMSDMLLALWTTLAVALAVRALSPPGASWAVLALGAVLGLGFLTKGPVAVLLPGLGVLALGWQRRKQRWPVSLSSIGLAALLFALTGLGWFALVFWRLGPGPLEYFFLRENVQRFAADTYDAGQPPWFYLVTYLAEGVPWSLFFPLAVWRVWRTPRDRAGAGGFLLLWLSLMAVPLSLSRGKIDYYLLPFYPAISLLIGRALATWKLGALEKAWSQVVLVLAALAVLAVPLLAARLPERWGPALPGQLGLWLVAAAACLACLAAIRRPGPVRVTATLALAAAAAFLALTVLVLPAFRRSQPNDKVVADVMRERLYRPDLRMVLCQDRARVQRDVLFQARLAAEERCDLWGPASTTWPYLFLLTPQETLSIAAAPGVREVARYPLLPATALGLRGMLAGPQPDQVVLLANFETRDPVAEGKRRRERKKALEREYGQ
jgi:4-amino-4-deoxy-L-arabinose transferase-like glycosyltransferase